MRKHIAVLAGLLTLVACSARVSGRPAPVRSSSTVSRPVVSKSPAPRIVSAWVDRSFRPVGNLVAVRGGFATYAFDPVHKALEVVGLRANDGAMRWRAPASASNITPGVGMFLSAQGNTVVYQRPGAHPRTGEVSIVAVDGTTGHPLWTHRSGLDLHDNVTVCDSGRHVCVHEGSALVVLNLSNGAVIRSAFLDARRSLGNEMYDQDPTHLARMSDHGRLIWSHSTAWLFPGPPASPENGWDFDRKGSRYVGVLGQRSPHHGSRHSLPATTAAFRISDGTPLWHRPGLELSCDGEVRIATNDLVGCEMSGGSIAYHGRSEHYDHVTLALVGIDPVTGKDRWRWDSMGHIRSAVELSPNQFVVNREGDLFLVNGATGVSRFTGSAVGWCQDSQWVTPRVRSDGYPDAEYAVGQIRPCTASGRHPALPASLPDFAVTRSAGMAAWSQSDGVHAAITR